MTIPASNAERAGTVKLNLCVPPDPFTRTASVVRLTTPAVDAGIAGRIVRTTVAPAVV